MMEAKMRRGERELPTVSQSSGELRCVCGCLLARVLEEVTAGTLELKCRRCKRLVTVGRGGLQHYPI
jgi:hypothetical protein